MSNRPFGVEIECYAPEGSNYWDGDPMDGTDFSVDLLENNGFDDWARLVTDDESLSSGYGAEIKSPVLQGNSGFQELKKVFKLLNDNNYWVDKTCGFHVHLDAPEFKVDSKLILKAVRAWKRNQHLVNNMVNESRVGNDNCLTWTDGDVHQLEQYIKDWENDLGHIGSTLRGAINFGSLPYHGSIEIRQHEGTLSYQEASSWIKFCQAFLDSVTGTTIQKMNKEDLLLKRLNVEKNASRFLTTKARLKKERSERTA